MPVTAPVEFYEVVRRASEGKRPELICLADPSDVAEQLGRVRSSFGSVFSIARGERFASKMDSTLDELQSAFFTPNLRVFQTQKPAIEEVARQFVGHAHDRPVLMYGHAACWTDKAVAEVWFGNDFHNDPFPPIRLRPARDIRLSFDEIGQRGVTLPALPLLWVAPAGAAPEKEQFVKLRDVRQVSRGGRRVSSSYREMVCMAGAGDEAAALLRIGLPPAIAGRAWSVADSDWRGRIRLSPLTIVGRSGTESAIPRSDTTAILDVELLKFQRLKLLGTGVLRMVGVEELTIATEPGSGRLVYVAASSDRFAAQTADAESFAQTHLGMWLRRYG